MLGHGRKGLVEGRLEPQCLGNAGLQIVTHDRLGRAAEEPQSSHLTFDPVGQLLAEAGMTESVGRCAKHRHEDLRFTNDAGLGIDDRHRLSGIIGLHDSARFVAVAEGGTRPALEGDEPLAEPGITVTVGMGRAIFLPQQRQRHALALHLLVDVGPIGCCPMAVAG